jgi:4-amino-4-deoxy-L-arabinose transferase-like glycosyltransferase
MNFINRVAKEHPRVARLWIVVAVTSVYVALTLGAALTKRPWSDEGWFANASWNLSTRGWMGTTVLEPNGFLVGIDQYTYWVMPLYLVVQAAWYDVFGFSLLSSRALSLIFGLIALFSWFTIMKSLCGEKLGLLTAGLLAFDYNFIMSSSFGRMDLMCAALGAAGMAAYLSLRKRNLGWAIFVSNSLVAASGMTHHLGILALIGLTFLIFWLDYKRLEWRYLATAVTPYALALLMWSFYIIKNPQLFITQFLGNAATDNRLQTLTAPMTALVREVSERYLIGFGLASHSVGHSGPIRLKALILLAYAVSITGVLLIAEIRKDRGFKTVLILTLLFGVTLSVWDGQKLTTYLIHVIPLYTAILAIWINWCWNKRILHRWLILLIMAGFVALQVGGTLQRIRLDTYHRAYLPAVNFLKKEINEGRVVMASAELGFGLGSFNGLLDDPKLGFFSGKRPDFIVVEEVYRSEIDACKTLFPERFKYANKLLSDEYHQIYDHENYQIFARDTAVTR